MLEESEPMPEELVLVEHDGAVAILTLNRPERKNALDGALVRALAAALDALRDEPGVRAIVLRGAGGVFSSGIDHTLLLEVLEKSQSVPFRHLHHDLQDAFHRIERMERPVVAALSRYCVGMALELALACDFRVAAEDCVLGLPEVAFGIVPDVGGTTRLVRTAGLQAARRLVLTGRLVRAARALEIGLVDAVAPDAAAAEAEALALAQHLASLPAGGVGLAKTLLLHSVSVDSATSFRLEGLVQSVLLQAPGLAEQFPGAVAFIREQMKSPQG
jgi:enoyl-CoA hydratase/carnithine racemase